MKERASIAATGIDDETILATLERLKESDADWRHARTFGLVYFGGEAHARLLEKASTLFASENASSPTAFKSLRRMEAEVVQMTASMLRGGRETVGTMTSGGSESILLAMKACRERAKKLKPWIKEPEIVAPTTVHVAFDKAAAVLGVKMRYAKVTSDLGADVDDMRKLATENTILFAASAPQYPHGIVDPIAEVGALAEERGVPFHVDASLGGYILPWVEKLGYPVAPFDFRVPGVTSMSADLHKYAYGANGAGVVLYRDMSYLRHQFFVSTDWSGGVHASTTIAGTRAGGPIAAAWASLRSLGEAGLLDHTRRAMNAARALREGIEAIDALEVLGDPPLTVFAFGSRDKRVDVYALADRLEELGWTIDRQQKPESLHMVVTSQHEAVVSTFLADLAEAVHHVKANPDGRAKGAAAVYGMMAKVPFRGMVKHSVEKAMDAMYGPDASDDVDPTRGEGGPILRALSKYGGVALGVLDRWDELKANIRKK